MLQPIFGCWAAIFSAIHIFKVRIVYRNFDRKLYADSKWIQFEKIVDSNSKELHLQHQMDASYMPTTLRFWPQHEKILQLLCNEKCSCNFEVIFVTLPISFCDKYQNPISIMFSGFHFVTFFNIEQFHHRHDSNTYRFDFLLSMNGWEKALRIVPILTVNYSHSIWSIYIEFEIPSDLEQIVKLDFTP